MDWSRYDIRNVDWSKVGKAAKETLISIGQGTFLLRLRVDKLLPYILVFFTLGCLNIWLNYETEQAALKVEKNKAELEALKIYHADMNGKVVEINRLSTVEEMLKNAGSEIGIPEKPADIIR